MLKRLLYISASIFILAAAYHLGASTATAEAPGNPIVAAASGTVWSCPDSVDGSLSLRWDRRQGDGARCAPGAYLCRASQPGAIVVNRVVVMR